MIYRSISVSKLRLGLVLRTRGVNDNGGVSGCFAIAEVGAS